MYVARWTNQPLLHWTICLWYLQTFDSGDHKVAHLHRSDLADTLFPLLRSLGWIHPFVGTRAEREISKILNDLRQAEQLGSASRPSRVWASNVVSCALPEGTNEIGIILLGQGWQKSISTIFRAMHSVHLLRKASGSAYRTRIRYSGGFVGLEQNVFFYLLDKQMMHRTPRTFPEMTKAYNHHSSRQVRCHFQCSWCFVPQQWHTATTTTDTSRY
jgi:hypothetical protein